MPTVKQHVERIQRANRAAFLARHNPLTWTPRDGETVHLCRDNQWKLPAGRYTLDCEPGDSRWRIIRSDGCGEGWVAIEELQSLERRGTLTPISQSELAREVEEVRLRLRAPLRGNRLGAMRAQHDASALPLFVAANEPALL